MTSELPFNVGCFYDAEAVAAAFVSAGQPVSVRSVRRWIDRDAARGFFLSARSEGELRRKVAQLAAVA